jgi:HNH endonuclease
MDILLKLKAHPTIAGLYASPEGIFYKQLPTYTDTKGYTCLRADGCKITRRHFLILEIYKGPRPFPDAVSRHLDGNPQNDSPGNLEWGTQKENMADTIKHGTATRGEKSGTAKLTRGQMEEIKRRRLAGEMGTRLAEEFGVSSSTVCDIIKSRTWVES